MKKNIDSKALLFENMAKLNSNFKINESSIEEKLTDYVNPALVNQIKDEEKNYNDKANEVKGAVENLLKMKEFDALDTLYKLLIGKRGKKSFGEAIQEAFNK